MEGFFDIQVNGYAGANFNSPEMTAEQLHACCERLVSDGVAGILATVTTKPIDVMCRCLANIVAIRRADPLVRRMISGFHIEGPFINPAPGYRGAHEERYIVPAEVDGMERILDAGEGLIRIVSLAPERDEGFRLTRLLADRGVVVSAAHCDPTLEVLAAAIDAGLSMFTHLGNGCADRIQRHDNIVQRALSLRDRLWLCFIADGVHIPFFALGNYLRAANPDRTIVVTDAVFPAGLGPGTYELHGMRVRIGEDLAIRSPEGPHLLGSAMTMRQNEANLRGALGLSDEVIRRLAIDNPRRAVGIPE